MEQTRRIQELIAPSLEALGYEVVRVRLGGGRQPTLQVMIERRDLEPLSLDACAEASRAISALLDVEDPLKGAYLLEVSSPGIDRPLVRLQDFERFAGFEAKIELAHAIEGRRRFRGRVLGAESDSVRIKVDHDELSLPLAAVKSAKLVLTDELIAATQKERRG